MNVSFKHLVKELYSLRSGFSTWLASRNMFVTLATLSQCKIVISNQIDSLAAINIRDQITIYLHPNVVNHYKVDQQVCYFLLMHELRHLTQLRGCHDWSKWVNFKPLTIALLDILPDNSAKKYGITDMDADLEYKHDIFNLAADAAIHEDIEKLFDDDIFERVRGLSALLDKVEITENNSDYGPVTVSFIQKMVDFPLERGQDWVYYARAMIRSLASRVRKEPKLAQLIVDRQILRKIAGSSSIAHLMDDEELTKIDRSLMRSEGASKAMIEAQLDLDSVEAAFLEGDDRREVHQARSHLSQAIQKILCIVRRTITEAQVEEIKRKRTYHRPNIIVPEAPGKILKRKNDKSNSSILVFDTSGSMWLPILMENMANLAFQMMKRKLIKQAFCCDVDIYPIENIASGSVELTGCGGTAWTVDHNSDLISRVYGNQVPNEPVSIYYCTDEEVYGLGEAQEDPRVNLVVINLPRIINENSYKKAKL